MTGKLQCSHGYPSLSSRRMKKPRPGIRGYTCKSILKKIIWSLYGLKPSGIKASIYGKCDAARKNSKDQGRWISGQSEKSWPIGKKVWTPINGKWRTPGARASIGRQSFASKAHSGFEASTITGSNFWITVLEAFQVVFSMNWIEPNVGHTKNTQLGCFFLYLVVIILKIWWRRRESNPRPNVGKPRLLHA